MVEICLGGIDLDPCAETKVNPNVPAKMHYTKEDNGLSKKWYGTVFMNPPYGREIIKWVTKLEKEYDSGRVKEALALVPAKTDTKWWRVLRDHDVCFIKGRLTFVGNDHPAPFPYAIFYLGEDPEGFWAVFSDIGDIWRRL